MLLVDHIQACASRHPDRVAVSSEHESLSYRDLTEISNRIAWRLLETGISPGAPVGLCLTRGAAMVPALLGILKAGGACVPLDPEYPDERLHFMVRDTEAPIVLSDRRSAERFADLHGVRTITFDRPADLDHWPPTEPVSTASATDLAYVLYTSGSSGTPKGVEIEHGALRDNAVKTAHLLKLSMDDSLLQFASLSFASSLGQIFAPLVTGARIVVRSRQYSGVGLLKYIGLHGITVLWLTPSVISQLISGIEASGLSLGAPLRLLRSGGEALTAPLVQRWFAHSTVPLLNVYGPTEAVQDITAHLFTEPADSITIGKPLAEVEVYVLDAAGQPVEEGQPGNLHFSSPGMARGYLNQPTLTNQRFATHEMDGRRIRLYDSGDVVRRNRDGDLEYLGRRDRQVKIRGQRTELAEVESRLLAHPGVHEAAVVLSSEPGNERLIAYYVSPAGGLDELELMQWCAASLPAAAVPASYTRVDELPLTVNGKLDRKTLEMGREANR